MAVLTQQSTLGDGIRWEMSSDYSREKITVASGNVLSLLEVIGRQQLAIPTDGTADAGNTGDGTLTGVAGGSETIIETITVECIAAAVDGGTFSVIGSKTGRLPDAVVGAPYTSEYINFTINDGATDFAAGDKFTIAIAAGSGKAVPLSLTAVDGSQKAAGIMIGDCDASAGDTQAAAIVRDALIDPDNLVWPDTITADQKTQALAELAELGIIARETA